MRAIPTLLMAACAGVSEPDVADTDAPLPADDTDVAPDTDATDVPPADTDSGGGDTDRDTDPPAPARVRIDGELWCVVDGHPAAPGYVAVLVGPGVACLPLGGGCNPTGALELGRADVDRQGKFSLDVDAAGHAEDELWLFSDNPVGTCGSGYHFTQVPLADLPTRTNLQVEVYSVFYL